MLPSRFRGEDLRGERLRPDARGGFLLSVLERASSSVGMVRERSANGGVWWEEPHTGVGHLFDP